MNRRIVLPKPTSGEQFRITAFDEHVRLEGCVLPPEDMPETLRPGETITFVARVSDAGTPDERRWWERCG